MLCNWLLFKQFFLRHQNFQFGSNSKFSIFLFKLNSYCLSSIREKICNLFEYCLFLNNPKKVGVNSIKVELVINLYSHIFWANISLLRLIDFHYIQKKITIEQELLFYFYNYRLSFTNRNTTTSLINAGVPNSHHQCQ